MKRLLLLFALIPALLACSGIARATAIISDVDLWFAIYDPGSGKQSSICKNPRVYPAGPACSTATSPKGEFDAAPLWVASGTTVRMWVDAEFTRWQSDASEPGAFKGRLQYEASIWDHDEEAIPTPNPDPWDDKITETGVTQVGRFPDEDDRVAPRATIGPFDVFLTRTDISGTQRVNYSSSFGGGLLESGFVSIWAIRPNWETCPPNPLPGPLYPTFEDCELEKTFQARTLEIFVPEVRVFDMDKKILLDAKSSTTFYFTVVLPGKSPPRRSAVIIGGARAQQHESGLGWNAHYLFHGWPKKVVGRQQLT